MSQTSENNKRIAKNTIALYIRTLVTMAVGLFTSRVVLNVLGIEDYGVYNVVGGVVSMFTIVTASLSQSISRYLTFELGKGNRDKLRTIFCTSVNIQLLMSLVVIVLMECIGIWFLNTKMNIDANRMYAANWVFQFSVLTFVINLISVPYNAAIIAHEKMKAFAYVSILEAVLKLVIVAALLLSSIDKLITYAFFQLLVSITIRMVYGSYCKRHFEECRYSFVIDKQLLKDMTGFAGWSSTAAIAWVFNTQGINILSNIFFGVVVNAARGVATQVEGIVKGFVINFTTAVRPQIIKSYSSGDKAYLFRLLCSSTKYSYFLMLVFFIPFLFEAETILRLWLKNYPDYAPLFLRLTFVFTLVSLLGDLMFTNILAIGKLKAYMICETIITGLVFPLTYVFFYLGFSPAVPYALFALAYAVLIFVRLVYLKREEGFPMKMYLTDVLLPVLVVTASSCVAPYLFKSYVCEPGKILHSLLDIFVCGVSVLSSIYVIGTNAEEKAFVKNKIHNIYKRVICRQ